MLCKVPLSQIDRIYNVLKNVKTQSKSVKVKYVIAKLLTEIEKELNILKQVAEPSNEFKQFEEEKLQLLMKYAKRDEKGNIVYEDSNKRLIMIESEEGYRKLKELTEKYKDAIEERRQQLDQLRKTIATENMQVQLPKLTFSDLDPDLPQEVFNIFVKLDLIDENHDFED